MQKATVIEQFQNKIEALSNNQLIKRITLKVVLKARAAVPEAPVILLVPPLAVYAPTPTRMAVFAGKYITVCIPFVAT